MKQIGSAESGCWSSALSFRSCVTGTRRRRPWLNEKHGHVHPPPAREQRSLLREQERVEGSARPRLNPRSNLGSCLSPSDPSVHSLDIDVATTQQDITQMSVRLDVN